MSRSKFIKMSGSGSGFRKMSGSRSGFRKMPGSGSGLRKMPVLEPAKCLGSGSEFLLSLNPKN
jgi:hypothetical protein